MGLNSEEDIELLITRNHERISMLPWEKRSINRSQAMEKLQPMIDSLDQSNTTANSVPEVEATFTKESVKVLP